MSQASSLNDTLVTVNVSDVNYRSKRFNHFASLTSLKMQLCTIILRNHVNISVI